MKWEKKNISRLIQLVAQIIMEPTTRQFSAKGRIYRLLDCDCAVHKQQHIQSIPCKQLLYQGCRKYFGKKITLLTINSIGTCNFTLLTFPGKDVIWC